MVGRSTANTFLLNNPGLVALLCGVIGVQSCSPVYDPDANYEVDTVRFVNSDPSSVSTGTVPRIWINTNTKLSGFSGGTVRSQKPYAIQFDYTDNTFTLTELEFTGVTLTYDDGRAESAVQALSLPLRIRARRYESVNSMHGGGRIKTTARILSGQMPGMVTRDDPFTLQIEGYFSSEDGSKIPFVIKEHYDIQTETSTKKAAEVLSDL